MTGKCAPQAVANTVPCDDGNACTVSDLCKDGVCASGANICSCQQDSECAKEEDGNVCNGTLYCDKSKFPFKCIVNPATLIKCPTVDNTQCSSNQCDAKTGQCSVKPDFDGKDCNADNTTCTPKDTCKAGSCEKDANLCDCLSNADCVQFEDGDWCNGTLYCDKTRRNARSIRQPSNFARQWMIPLVLSILVSPSAATAPWWRKMRRGLATRTAILARCKTRAKGQMRRGCQHL